MTPDLHGKRQFLVLAFVLCGGMGSNLRAQAALTDDDALKGPVRERLARSASALQSFRGSPSESVQKLVDRALCILVAPRSNPEVSAAEVNGFASCRPGLEGAWSNPAAIVIEGGGIFWPVFGSRIDVILLTTNQSTASRFSDPEGLLGADPATRPGPVRLDQMPPRIGGPAIFAYEQSTTGITGIDIAGATMSEDRATNAVLYGRELSNADILSRRGGRSGLIEVDLFLTALAAIAASQ